MSRNLISGSLVENVAEVTFAEPVIVMLPGRRPRHRVLAVYRAKNPNGLFRGKRFTYARAEWELGDRWLPVRELVALMQLANATETVHGLPRNPQPYAQAVGAQVL